jgi:hypothetical protein
MIHYARYARKDDACDGAHLAPVTSSCKWYTAARIPSACAESCVLAEALSSALAADLCQLFQADERPGDLLDAADLFPASRVDLVDQGPDGGGVFGDFVYGLGHEIELYASFLGAADGIFN